MVRFVRRYGYPVSYTIDSIDRDPAQLQGARGMINIGRSKYWSGATSRRSRARASAGRA